MAGDFVSARGDEASAKVMPPLADGADTLSKTPGQATFWRHRQAQRDERLEDMREQVADGTLVVRQMSAQERAAGQADVRKPQHGRSKPSYIGVLGRRNSWR